MYFAFSRRKRCCYNFSNYYYYYHDNKKSNHYRKGGVRNFTFQVFLGSDPKKSFRETTTAGGTTTQGVTTTPDDYIPGCPCNGMSEMEQWECFSEQALLDPNPCDAPPGKNSSIFRRNTIFNYNL